MYYLGLMKSKLVENIVALYLVQGLNYLLPLITLPYLLRVIRTEKYGLISLALCITVIIMV